MQCHKLGAFLLHFHRVGEVVEIDQGLENLTLFGPDRDTCTLQENRVD